ncbi:cation-translocating P-type ATPase [Janthinobacterium fluminis]|uniref:Cation-transporting P-type ATPase n=1 Tax=Janthinobacterium fluminis TaxID=2987524 RepID=A0ABT5JUZ3_9BURK|nr:cation-transporting P-type ATPase [Janthinobacterium fluminis]MDC8756528.1 cation-transporting P-type ATPase [Janthinobacterium fluminis]
MSRHHGITAVYANPLTARVLILFDPSLQTALLLAEIGISAVSRQADASVPAAVAAPPRSPPRAQPGYAPWHGREAAAALAFFGSAARRGLAQDEAERRLRQGQNVLSKAAPVSSLEIALNQFKNLPSLLLGVSALVSVATGGLPEAAAIAAVLVLNGGIGFVTERRAESTIASLSELVDDVVPVLRDGAVRQVESAHLVPGDILVLTPGIRIGADARLLQSSDLSIDESALTGESLPAPKDSAPLPPATPLPGRRNMAYRGTAVSAGSGLALVVGTGDNTEVGAIQALSTGTRRPKTPIQRQLDHLGNQLVKVSGAICLGIFGLGLLRGYHWLHILKTSTSLAIAALPEGLPAVATTSLARGIRRMREHQVLMRRLHAVETIGAIQTICLDKTGTLTLNRMSAVALRSHALQADRTQADWPARAADDAGRAELARLLQVCVLCNQAELRETPPQDAAPNGSATENALLELAAGAGIGATPLRRHFPLLQTELRMEGRNYMRTLHAMPDAARRLIAVKGNPAEVLDLCTHYLAGAQALALDAGARNAIARQNEGMAEQQLRVLGFAFAEAPAGADAAPLTWIGLVGLADPLRPGVERVIASFHDAGIRTVMLTGDQAATAYVIGQSLHLNNGDALHIVDAEQLEAIAPQRLQALADNAHIFSRVSPARKLQIVRALQRGGKTIAMTGDGINDGPALRAADIGIAMGGGTDVALSVADVVLKGDRLDTLLEAVRQGRTISNNIRKSLHFLLSSNLSEILAVLGSVALGSGQPLTPVQLLWLNLLSDMLPAIALVAEPAEGDVMQQAPRDPQRPIVGAGELRLYAREAGWLAGGALGAYLGGVACHGDGRRAGSIAFNALVLGQLLHALSCRSERRRLFAAAGAPPNHHLSLAVGASIGLQVAANLLPGLRRVLGIAPMGALDALLALAGAGLPLLVNEAAKPATPPD